MTSDFLAAKSYKPVMAAEWICTLLPPMQQASARSHTCWTDIAEIPDASTLVSQAWRNSSRSLNAWGAISVPWI
jgi:hypothetical protein